MTWLKRQKMISDDFSYCYHVHSSKMSHKDFEYKSTFQQNKNRSIYNYFSRRLRAVNIIKVDLWWYRVWAARARMNAVMAVAWDCGVESLSFPP